MALWDKETSETTTKTEGKIREKKIAAILIFLLLCKGLKVNIWS